MNVKLDLKIARATSEDVEEMRNFLRDLDEKVNDSSNDLNELGMFCHAHFNSKCGRHYERMLLAYETLAVNACDQSVSYLAWKPELEAAVNSLKEASNYIRPNITQKMKYDAEKSARELLNKYGYNNAGKIVGSLAVENMRLVAEINEHRAARGIDPLPVFEV